MTVAAPPKYIPFKFELREVSLLAISRVHIVDVITLERPFLYEDCLVTNASVPLIDTADDDVRRHLLLAFPELDLAHDPGAVVASLVEGALFALVKQAGRSQVFSAVDVIRKIKETAGLQYETVEVVSALESLAGSGYASIVSERRDAVVLSPTRIAQLQAVLDERLGLGELVRNDWFAELGLRHSFSAGQLQQLWAGLQALMTATINSHAAEAAAFLYLSTDSDQARFYAALNAKLPVLQDVVASNLQEIARREFHTFFQTAGPKRIEYLALQLRGAFYLHLLAIDPKASQLVRGSVSGKVLYLDTNVLFRALGLHGPALLYAPAMTIEVARRLGCKLVVTRATVDEFLYTLRSEVKHVRSLPIERRTYQDIIADHPTDECAFMYAYYRELTSGRVKSVDEFELKYSNVEKYLQPWSVEIEEVRKPTSAEYNSDEYRDLLSELNQWHHSKKALAAVEHDAFMLRLVRKKRGEVQGSAGSVKYWFLTYDRRLAKFAVHQSIGTDFPECMLADSWLQIARPFLPRTDDYDKSLASLLQHPLLYHDESAVPFDHMVQALHRLDRYEEVPTTVLAGMLADSEFVRRLREAPSEADERELLELKLASIAKAAEEQAAKIAAELDRARRQIDSLTDTARSARQEKETAEEEARRTKLNTAKETATLVGEQERRLDELRTRHATDLARAKQESKGRWLWTIYVLLVVALLLVTALSLLNRRVPATTTERIVWGSWLLLASILLLGIPLKRKFGTVAAIASLVGTLLGLVGSTVQLLGLSERNHTPQRDLDSRSNAPTAHPPRDSSQTRNRPK